MSHGSLFWVINKDKIYYTTLIFDSKFTRTLFCCDYCLEMTSNAARIYQQLFLDDISSIMSVNYNLVRTKRKIGLNYYEHPFWNMEWNRIKLKWILSLEHCTENVVHCSRISPSANTEFGWTVFLTDAIVSNIVLRLRKTNQSLIKKRTWFSG